MAIDSRYPAGNGLEENEGSCESEVEPELCTTTSVEFDPRQLAESTVETKSKLEELDAETIATFEKDEPESEESGTEKNKRANKEPIYFFIAAIVAVLLWGGAGFYAAFFVVWPSETLGKCGDCYCSLTEGEVCPSWSPATNFSLDVIETFSSQIARNPFTLSCDPYKDNECTSDPPQEAYGLGESTVCAIHYDEKENVPSSPVGATYWLRTHINKKEAEIRGGRVTHYGACGVCSTTQDLAAYMRYPDLTTNGRYCSKQGILNFDWGVDCYMDLGFTEPCAEMWIYNGRSRLPVFLYCFFLVVFLIR
jgi:hypothetical protein